MTNSALLFIIYEQVVSKIGCFSYINIIPKSDIKYEKILNIPFSKRSDGSLQSLKAM
jgi:hypothetical protein